MRVSRYSRWHTKKVGGTTVSVRPKPRTPYTVLRVESMIDTGTGRQTAILKNALPDELEIDLSPVRGAKGAPELPKQISHLNCIYTGRGFGIVADVAESLKAVTGNAKLAAIVPDVVRPGDFMIFRHGKSGMRFAGVMRPITAVSMKREKDYNANKPVS